MCVEWMVWSGCGGWMDGVGGVEWVGTYSAIHLLVLILNESIMPYSVKKCRLVMKELLPSNTVPEV